LNTPVIFLIFNRPKPTKLAFDEIRRARPPKLLIVADGPRRDRPEDVDLCEQTRAVLRDVDWPCEVLRKFSPENLGCKQNVSQGLDWAFDHVEEAIILEDDCLPDPTFFRFCEELLDRYRPNEHIAQVCGSNYQQGIRRTSFSYYFSRHAHIWGWATWRRSWQHNDLSMSAWPQLRDRGWLKQYLGNSKAAFYWRKLFDDSIKGDRDSLNSWAIPWTFSCWARGGVSIIPEINLISNIGYSKAGTHTSARSTGNATPRNYMSFPLKHPAIIETNREADAFTEETFYYGSTFLERCFWAWRLPFSVSTVRRIRRLTSRFLEAAHRLMRSLKASKHPK
jgi:hypothetical protein